MIQILFIGEGSSDSGIAVHIRRIAAERGHESFITDPLVQRLPPPPRRTVAAKLQAVRDLGGSFDLLVLHRDADRDGRAPRLAEISAAAATVMPGVPHVPVIPIRMTEAWLLLDEAQIRRVAGAPHGRMPLSLPKASTVESVPDPKAVLKETLARASGLTGRKLATLNGRFDRNRALLWNGSTPKARSTRCRPGATSTPILPPGWNVSNPRSPRLAVAPAIPLPSPPRTFDRSAGQPRHGGGAGASAGPGIKWRPAARSSGGSPCAGRHADARLSHSSGVVCVTP